MALAALLYIYRVTDTTSIATVTPEYIEDGRAHVLQDKHVPSYVTILRIHGPLLSVAGAAAKASATVFPEGVAFSGKAFDRTVVTSSLFEYLRPLDGSNENLVDLTGASWNRFQQFLQGIHGLHLAFGPLAGH